MPTTPTDAVTPLSRLAPASPWGRWALAGLALFAAWGVLAVWTPSEDIDATICLFRRVTHHDCATCGMTRAFAALAKGDVRGAAAHHPLAVPLAAEIVVGWLFAGLAIARRWRVPTRTLALIGMVNLAVVLGVWVVRLASGKI